jgi:ABC-type amino acid transport substrate-binding protein
MNKVRFLLCAVIVLLVSVSTGLYAQTYIVAVGDIPGLEPLKQMIKTMGEEMNVKLEFKTVPMQRMVNMLISREADIGVPMLALKDQEQIKKLPFDYSTDPFQTMSFVLYTNKSKPIDIASLKSGNPKGFKIESDISNMNMFKFTTLPSTVIDGSFKKVDGGQIDGYIMGQLTSDPVLKALKLKNIKRQLYEVYDIVFALQKGARGTAVDKFISEGLKKLKASGKYDTFMKPAIQAAVYDDWQP